MIGKLIYETIPFKNFKEKIRITKEYKKYKMEIYKNYVLVKVGGNLK